MPYVFYDTETTGVATAFSQILQFAAIKTDDELNEIDRFEVRCRLLPHIIPSPEALLVTRISPETLTDPGLPTHYEAVREIRKKLVEWSPSVFIGYNSIAFDEELLRQAFFQTLHPTYLTNTNGNQRSDVMRIAHSTDMYQRNTISVPLDDKGKQTFRLDQLAPINGFDHSRAHDAMADVEATIFMARLVKERANGIWNSMRRFVNKNQVLDYVMKEPCFSLSERYFGRMYSWLVTYCGRNPDYDSQLAVFDLDFDPDEYLSLSVEELVKVLGKSPKAIRAVVANRQPIMMPPEAAPEETKALAVPVEERNRRIEAIENDRPFVARVGEALSQRFADREASPHLEKRIYEGFPGRADLALIDHFHEERWDSRIALIEQIQDARLVELANRLVYFERPDLLSDRMRHDMDDWLVNRILAEDASVPWMTVNKALAEVEERLETSDGGEVDFLGEIRDFLIVRPHQLSVG
ncbi:MAG TPA: exodeoxyribonuclease I [Alphaproteobacteria bacterium]|nr:exodeoxyribonuclease I [Alphaproteobacteria bacterium]